MASLTDRLPLYGGVDDNALVGGVAADIIHGDAGDDTLSGAGGDDTLIGGVGDDLLFGGSGANVLFGGDGADILTYDSGDANGALQRLFGDDGVNTLVLEFTQEDYLADGVIAEVQTYANALAAGENPGDGAEFVFQTFALRAANFSNILIFVDGAPIAPGEVPGVDAVGETFAVSESGTVSGDVTLNDNVPADAAVSLLTPVSRGDLTVEADGSFTFETSGAFEALSAGDTETVTFTYRLAEGDDTSDATVEITVSGENDAPTAGVAAANTDENQSISGDLIADSSAVDIDQSDVLTILSVNGEALNGAQRAITLPSGAVISVAPAGDYTYAPGAAFDSLAAGATATELISFIIADGRGGQVASSLTLTIDGENDAPVANPDAAITTEDDNVAFDVLGNDTDVDQGDVLTVVSIDSVSPGGSAVITSDGLIQFQPGDAFENLSAGANAFVEIAYTMQDASGARISSTAIVTVTGVNDAPTAANVSDSTSEDANLTGNLLSASGAADIDSADVLTIAAIDGVAFAGGFSAQIASGATLTVMANGDYTYSPTSGFNNLAIGDTATDSFTFTVSDGRGGQVVLTFSIDITGENDGPIAQNFAISAPENGGGAGNFLAASNASDPDDGAVLSVTEVNGAATGPQTPFFTGSNGGRLVEDRGSFTFDPDGGFEQLSVGDVATTTFTFTIEDDQGASVTRTLTVEVQGENDDPTADPVDFQTDEDTETTGNLLTASLADDIDQNDTLTVTEILADSLVDGALNGAERTFVLGSGATITVAPDGAFTFQPSPQDQSLAEGEQSLDSFAFRISDGQGGEIVVNAEATIDGLNDDPTADPIARAALEDSNVAGNLLTDSNADDVDNGDFLQLAEVDGQPVGTSGISIAGADGGLLFVGDLGGYTFNPNGDFEFLSVGDTATSTFTFRIEDSFGAFVEQDITFNVAGANDAPTVDPIDEATDEDTALSGNLIDDSSASDVDQNDVLTISEVNADSILDGALNGATRIFTLGSGAQLTVSADGTYTYDPLQAFQSLPQGGTDGDFVSFVVVDGNGGSASESLTISVAGVNDAPTLDPITATTGENAQITGDLVADSNAADVDLGDTVTINTLEGQDFSAGTVTITRPGEGRLVAEGSGYRYDPLTDFDRLSVGDTADVSYEFTVRDNFGATATTTITFTITGENDGPTADDVNQSTTEDDILDRNLLSDSNAQDIDLNDTLTISQIDIDGAGAFDLNGATITQTLANGAVLTISPDGSYEVDPAGNFDTLAPGDTSETSFEFTVSDGNGGEVVRTAVISITGVNDAPVAVDDTASTDQDTIETINILGNDFDVDGVFTLTSVTQPDNGGAVLTGNGVAFDPIGQFDFLGDGEQTTTTFTYTITDDLGATGTASVVVTVDGLNDAPITTPVMATTDEDRAAFMFDLLAGQVDLDQNDVLSVENFTENSTTFGAFSISNGIFTFDARQFDALVAGDSQIIFYNYDVVDSFGARVSNTFTLTVEGRDEGVDAVDDNYTTDEDTAISDDVSLNDTIGTGTYSLDQDVDAGILTLNSDGTFDFDPNGEFDFLADGELDSVMFTYVLDDGTQTSMATATIDIQGLNDGPIADDILFSTDEDTEIDINLIDESNAFDPDATGPIELDSVDGVFLPVNNDDVFIILSSGAAITASRDGEITYDPTGVFDQLSDGDFDFDDFSFELIDDFGDITTVIADVDIDGVNDPVEAEDSSFTADEDAGASGNLISLSNATDIDANDEIVVTNIDGTSVFGGATVTLSSGALLTIDEFGAFTYDANGQFEGLAEGETADDSFTYSISDGFVSVDLTSTITVEGANDAPVIDQANSNLSDTFTATGGAAGAAVINAADLDGTNGFALVGDSRNYFAGSAVAGGGDVNGDGFDDLVVGIPGYEFYGFYNAGSAFVLFGDGAATAPATRTIPEITPVDDGVSLLSETNDRLGGDAAFVGDVNGDGFDDFLIGSSNANTNGSYRGVAQLVFGRDFNTANVRDYIDSSTATEFIDSSTGFDGTRNLGASVASAGDINNDGVNDFIIGAPFITQSLDDDFAKAFVVFGRSASDTPFGATFDLATLDGNNGFRIDTGYNETGTLLGYSVDGVGDVNGDGIDDVFVGAPGATQEVETGPGEFQTYNSGASYIIFGSERLFGPSVDVLSLTPATGLTVFELFGNSRLGVDVSAAGDFNGDGIDDFIVGSDYSNTGPYSGDAFLIYGSPTIASDNIELSRLAPRQGFRILGAESYDYVGTSLSAAGDVNGDGFDDIIIGAQSNFEGLLVGEAYILFGTDAQFTAPLDLADFDENDGVKLNGIDTGGEFGAKVSGAGDLNQDGFDDVIVGAPSAGEDTLARAGAAFVFFGAASAGGGGGPVGGAGSVFFTDVDLTDIHTVSDDAIIDDIDFTFDLVTDSTGGLTGEALWTSEIDQAAFDALAEGQTSSISVNVTIEDAFGGEDTATIDIDYVGINDAPTSEDAIRTTDEDTPITDGDLFVEGNIMDVDDGDVLRIASVLVDIDSSTQTFVLDATQITIDVRGADLTIDETGQYSFDPSGRAFDFLDDGDMATTSFRYVVEDLAGATSESAAVITITGVNDAPTATDDTATTDQDNVVGISLFDNDSDPEGGLSIRSVDTTGTLGAVFVENANAGTVVYNPNGAFDFLDEGESATDTFSYLLQDSGGLNASADVTVTVTGLNDAPVANDLNRAGSEDDTLAGSFITDSGSFDPDANDTLVVSAINGVDVTGANQTINLASGSRLLISPNGDFTYNPFFGTLQTLPEGQVGTDNITFTLSDGDVTTDAALNLSITGVNDAPTATPLARTTNEDEAAFVVDLLANAIEIDQGDTLSIENFVEVGTTFGSFTRNGADLTYNATIFDDLDAGQTQVINFTYDVVDSQGARVSTTLDLTIEGRDEGLLAVDDNFTTDEETPISGDVSTNDVDQGAAFSLVTMPTGDIVFNADGTFDYDPTIAFDSLSLGDQGTDTFTYQIDDGTDQVTADVTITVDGVNDAPAIIVPGVTNVRLVTEDQTDAAGGNNQSVLPAISGDGDTVVFDSLADDLIAGDTNVRNDVFFEDPAEDIFRANVQDFTNAQSDSAGASTAEVSADGKVIVFHSLANDLVSDIDGTPLVDNNQFDIYVRELDAEVLPGFNQDVTRLLIPFGTDGQRLNGASTNASVSADGRFVVFQSAATNVAANDTNGATEDVYLHDRLTGETINVREVISLEVARSFNPTISADGSTVVFLTSLSHEAADTNGLVDVYAYDVQTATLDLVSRSSSGVVGDQEAISFVGGEVASTPSVSANGRYVSWVSRATNLVDDDTNNADDIFVHDRFFGTTERVSVTFGGIEADGASFDAKLSDNGRFVAFQTQATNLDELAPDTNGENDVFVKDRITGDLIRVSVSPDFLEQPGGGQPDISADGTKIAFASATVTGNFDARVVTGNVNDIYVATIDTTGYNFTQNTPAIAAFVDLQLEWFDPDGIALEFSNISVTSDDTDRFFDVTEEFDDNGRLIGFSLDPSEFADLGVNDYELLTAEYDITDGIANSSGVTAVVIAGENDAPIADAQSFDVNQGDSVSGSFFAIDIDDDALTYSFFGSALQGDLVLQADGSFTYTSAADQTGDDIISISVDDGNGGITTFDATFNVNLAPIFTPTNEIEVALTAQVNPDPMNSIDAAAFFNDPEGGDLTFTAVTSGFTNLRNGLSIDAATGEITGTPILPGLDRVLVTATDTAGLSTTGGFWVARVGEVIFGDNDDNNIVDGPNSSLINGLGGNDSITGDNNTDIYQYRRGEGFDIINDTAGGGINRLVMTGFNSDEVQFSRVTANQYDDNGGDLLITPIGQPVDFTEGVLVRGALVPTNGASRLSFFHFDDGVIINETEAAAQILARETTDGNDDIRGFRTPDTLVGGLGDDVLSGGESSDLYVYNAGDGDDTIRDNGRFSTDIVEIGYNLADANFSRIPNTSIVVADFGGGDRLTFVGALHSDRDDGIEIFRFDDTEVTMADIRADLISQQITSGDDVLRGFGFGIQDTLDGGAGNDTLLGFDGGDTYQYRAGGGDDLIRETGFQDNDVLEVSDFTIDYDLVNGVVNPGSQVTFERGQSEGESIFQTAADLIINLDNGAGLTGSIRVAGGIATGNTTPLSSITFDASGVTLTGVQIRSDLLRQQETSGDDTVRGFQSADTLNGGAGNDLLLGRDGADTYLFATGDGDDTVFEGGFQEVDRVEFTDRNLADFEVRFAPQDDNTVVFTAGTDRIEILNGLESGVNRAISEFVFADGELLVTEEMRQHVVDQALALGLDLIGGPGTQIMPSSPGSNRFVEGRDGSDTYLYVTGDGQDTVVEGNTSDLDVLDLTAFSSQDFTLAGPSSIRFDPVFADRVQLRVDFSNTLDIINMSRFEEIRFSDQTFDNDTNTTDGQDNFTDFIAAQVAEALAANPNESFITKRQVVDPGGNNSFTSAAANEAFILDGSGDDQITFNVSEIGDDSVFKTSGTTSGYDITIDFTGIISDLVIEETITYSTSRLDKNDLIIDIVYEDSLTIEPTANGIGRVEERIILNNALAQFGGVDSITVNSNLGGLPSFATTTEIRQLIIDQAVTPGDDLIPNYVDGGLVLRGLGGDDTLSGDRGGQRFEFSPGDGRVTFAEGGNSGGGTDVLAVNGFSLTDADISRSPFDSDQLIFDFGNGDVLIVNNFFPGGFVLEQFVFQADSATPESVTGDEIATEYLSQLSTAGDDLIVGGGGRNETLDGGTGNDTLDGQENSDTYIVRRGEGDKLIRETGSGDTDILQLDVASDTVTFEQNPIDTNNFVIVMDDGTRVEIFNFLEGNDGKIEQFVFTDTTLDTTQARLRAFDDIATNGDDTIIGGDAPDTLRGGLGDDVLRGDGDNDVFVYAIGDGNDTLTTEATNNEFEFIQITGVAVEDVIFERIQGTRDSRSGQPSLDEDLLISFANDAGSIRVENGLRQGSAIDRVEIVDSGVTLTDSDIFNRVLVSDIANGRTILEGPSTGSVIFPTGAEFIFAQQQGDIFQFAAGQGTLTILDDAPTSETQRLEILGYSSTDAVFSRLAAGAEDFIIRLPNGDQIVVIGDQSGGLPVNGVNEIFFDGDGIVFNNADITTLIDGGSASGSSGGGSGGSGRVASPVATEASSELAPDGDAGTPSSDDDVLVLTSADDVMRLGPGDDHVRGRGGDDALWGQAGDDTLIGNGGADTLRGGGGEDELRGGGGRDKLIGGGGDDALKGNGGRDMLKGGAGADDLRGGAGNDLLKGGGGADRIEGGRGDDRLMGQGGEDTFVFASGFGSDVVRDFRDGADILDFVGHVSVSALGDLTITQVGADAVITDGVGGRITLQGVDADDLQADDFLF